VARRRASSLPVVRRPAPDRVRAKVVMVLVGAQLVETRMPLGVQGRARLVAVPAARSAIRAERGASLRALPAARGTAGCRAARPAQRWAAPHPAERRLPSRVLSATTSTFLVALRTSIHPFNATPAWANAATPKANAGRASAGTTRVVPGARTAQLTPGWTSTTLAWSAFSLSEQAGTGVTLCHPDSYAWSDPQPATNQPQLNGQVTMRLLAYQRLDADGALTYIASQDTAQCTYEPNEMYGVRFPVIGGWPAMEQSYSAPAPVCGACELPPEAERIVYARVYVAAGTNVVLIEAVSSTDASPVAELFEIAQTIRVDNGLAPTDPSVGIATLTGLHQDGCQ
jgi:hypothetical protein